MLLELQPELSRNCSPVFQNAAALFSAKQSAAALQAAMAVFRATDCQWHSLTEFDWLLLSALCHHGGQHRRATAIHRLAFKHHPDSLLLGALHAWDLSASRKYFESKDLLERLAATSNAAESSLISALHAYNFSVMGWRISAEQHRDQSIREGAENPVTQYILSRSATRRMEWTEAETFAKKALHLSPSWPRAKMGLLDSLLAVGQNDQARSLLVADQDETPHVWLQCSRAVAFEALSERDNAIQSYGSALEQCTDRKLVRHVAARLLLLLKQRGDDAVAVEIVRKYQLEEYSALLQVGGENKSVYVPLPLVAQADNHCVPTVAAMVAGAQGYPACPGTFATEMGTTDGTYIWQMVDYMRSLGFRVEAVEPDVDVVKSMLDQGIPLVGQLPGLFQGHVDIVCGYDNHLGVFHLRDPMHWQGRHVKFDSLRERYEGSVSLLALIAPQRIKDVGMDAAWLNNSVMAFIDLSRAAAMGDRRAAEAAHQMISEDHPIAFVASQHGRLVTITERAYEKELKKVVDKYEAEDVSDQRVSTSSIKALLQFINADNADRIREITKRNEAQLTTPFLRYVEAQCLVAEGKWQPAMESLTKLAHQQPSSEQLWSQLANVQRQLGLRDLADASQQIVLEISPESNSGKRNQLVASHDSRYFANRLEQAKELVECYPANPSMRLTLASVLADGGDGRVYERSLKECIRYFPRYNWPYEQLANWYLGQERSDLAAEVLASGRELIGEAEMPLWEFEKRASLQLGRQNADSGPLESGGELESENEPSEDQRSASVSEHECASEVPETTEKISCHKTDFDQAWEPLADVVHSSKAEFEHLEAFRQMLTLCQENKIHWWQAARFLVLRLQNLVRDKSLDSPEDLVRANALREMLPKHLPGVNENFVDEYLDSFNLTVLSRPCQEVMLKWIDTVATQQHAYPTLRFNRAYLIELLDRLNESEAELKAIVEDHPAHQGAIYRLGQIAEQRGDFGTATQYYKKCLNVCPGHWGALEQLCSLAHQTGEELYRRLKDRWLAFPYQFGNLSAVAAQIAQSESHATAHVFIDRHSKLIEAGRKSLLHAQLHYQAGEYDRAIEILDANFDPDDQDYGAQWLACNCLIETRDLPELAKRLRRIDETWPDDSETLDQLARTLREINMSDAKAFAEQKLVAGNAVFVLAYICLQDEEAPNVKARSVLLKMKPDSREPVAELLCQAISELAPAAQTLEFIEHCIQEFPHNANFQIWLIHQLNAMESFEDATKAAKKLHDRAPNNPDYLDLLADCYFNVDLEQAMLCLERSYDMTGKVDTLIELGRVQGAAKKKLSAQRSFWEALKVDPVNTYAMTNLMWFFDNEGEKLWERIIDAFNTGAVSKQDSNYFLVAAQRFANSRSERLPFEWFTAAVSRAHSVIDYGGYNQERLELGTLMQQCISKWTQDSPKAGGTEKLDDVWIPQLQPGFDFKRDTGLSIDQIVELTIRLCSPGVDPSGYELTSGQAVEFHRTIAEVYMQEGFCADAVEAYRRSIRCLDDSVTHDGVSLVARLIDAENGGGWLDRLPRFVPGDRKDSLIVGGCVVAVVFALILNLLNRNYGLDPQLPIFVVALILIGVATCGFFKSRSHEERRLPELRNEPVFRNLERLRAHETSSNGPVETEKMSHVLKSPETEVKPVEDDELVSV